MARIRHRYNRCHNKRVKQDVEVMAFIPKPEPSLSFDIPDDNEAVMLMNNQIDRRLHGKKA